MVLSLFSSPFAFPEAGKAQLLTLDFFTLLPTCIKATNSIHEETASSKNLGKMVSASGLGSAS